MGCTAWVGGHLRTAKLIILTPAMDGLLHYGGRAWRSDGNVGNHYMVQGASMWHVQALKKDGTLQYGNLLLPAGPLHPHVSAHRPTYHHARHLHKKPGSEMVVQLSSQVIAPSNEIVTSRLSMPAAMESAGSLGEVQEREGVSARYDHFHDRHARGLMRAQGVVDIAAGGLGTFATAGAVVLMLAPETMGLSVVLGVAALATYEVFRSGVQVAAGMTELAASSTEDDKSLLETREQIDHLKTATSLAGLATMGAMRASHNGGGWEVGLMASDAEAVATGFILPDPFEEVFPLARLARAPGASKGQKALYAAKRAADAADKVDKGHAGTGDALRLGNIIQEHFDRKRKQQPNQPRRIPPPDTHP